MRRSGWWRELGPAQRQSIRGVDFDTGDRQLRDCNISLHTHTNGRAITQTVTMPKRVTHRSRPHGREWEMLVSDPVPRADAKVIDPALPPGLPQQAHLRRPARPVFNVEDPAQKPNT